MLFSRKHRTVLAAFSAAAVFWTAVAAADGDNNEDRSDPLETLNRFTSGFNSFLRKGFIDPVVDLYQYVTPDPMEEAIGRAAANLSEPITAGSSLLQGDTENAGAATQRFLINSTLGLAGLGDPATEMGIESRREDLGQTLGAHGVAPGPHIVLPILGPSNLRDVTGDLPLMILSPVPLAGAAAKGTVEYSGKQDTYRAIGEGSIDPYVAEREAYEQNRNYEVRNGDIPGPVFADEIKR